MEMIGNKTGTDDDSNVLEGRGKVDSGWSWIFNDLILRSIFFRSFANVATFFNVAGTKLGFRTFAKVFDRKQQF